MSSFDHIGKPTPRPEGGDKLTGKARYIHDYARPGMLHGKVKFSEHAHARILSIDISKAEALPGVHAVITGYNTPEIRLGFMRDNFVLKRDIVRQFRDEVAAVAAIDAETAQRAVDLIEVEYEPLPAVFTAEQAMAEGAPLLHEFDARGKPRKSNKLDLTFAHDTGDLAAAEKASAHIASGHFRVPLIQQSCMGTAGCIAEFDTSGNLEVIAKTQIPFLAQRDFAAALRSAGIGSGKVRVIVPTLGGGFGTGLDTHVYEYLSILLAHRSGKPVKVLYNREEEFAYLSPRQSAEVTIRQGCDENGKLTFRDIFVVQDNGAYASWGATFPSVMLVPATSLYQVPVVRFDSRIVYTNNTYCQAMRGYGNPEVTLPMESTMDMLAEMAGIDALEIRRINCNQPGELTPMGMQITTCGLPECIDLAAEKIGWTEKRGKGRHKSRGVGMASLIHVGGGGKIYRSDGSGIILKLDDYGTVNVSYGGVEMGQGLHAALTAVIAEGLGVKTEAVVVNQTDTATCPWDVGTHASRGAFMAGNAALMACKKLRTNLFDWAVRYFPAEVKRNLKKAAKADKTVDPSSFAFESLTAEDFELRQGVLFPKAASEDQTWLHVDLGRFLRAVHFSEQGAGTMFTQEAFYEPPTDLPDWSKGKGNMSANYTYGTQAVEVEVDTETGEVTILKLAFSLDVGRVLNRQTLEGQAYGALAQGIGYALYEEVLTDKGRVLNPGFTDYKLPTVEEMSFPIELDFVETNDPEGPYGAKGVGEPGLVPTAPAISNAIYDAIGVRIHDLPITPERILAALDEKASLAEPEHVSPQTN